MGDTGTRRAESPRTDAYARRINLLVLLFAAAIFAKTGGWDAWRKESVDLPSFYLGAKLAFFEHVTPYDRTAWNEAVREFAPQEVFPFLYPPPSLILFSPLPLLSHDHAKALVLLVNLVLLGVGLHLLLVRLMGLRSSDPLIALAILYVFASAPVYATLEHGQTNIAVLALLGAAWLGLKRERGTLAAALPLSLAILLKPSPIVALVYLALKRRFRVVGMTLGLLLAFSLVSLWLGPASMWSEWLRNVLPTQGYGLTPAGLFSPAAPWNQSLNGFTARLFSTTEFAEAMVGSDAAMRIVPYLLGGAVLLVSGWLWRGPGRSGTDLSGRELAHLLAAMFLVAPFSWEHHLVFLLPAVFLVSLDFARLSRTDWTAVLAGLAAVVIALPLRLSSPALIHAPFSLLISVKLYAVLVLWFYLTLWLWRARRAAPMQATPAALI